MRPGSIGRVYCRWRQTRIVTLLMFRWHRKIPGLRAKGILAASVSAVHFIDRLHGCQPSFLMVSRCQLNQCLGVAMAQQCSWSRTHVWFKSPIVNVVVRHRTLLIPLISPRAPTAGVRTMAIFTDFPGGYRVRASLDLFQNVIGYSKLTERSLLPTTLRVTAPTSTRNPSPWPGFEC